MELMLGRETHGPMPLLGHIRNLLLARRCSCEACSLCLNRPLPQPSFLVPPLQSLPQLLQAT